MRILLSLTLFLMTQQLHADALSIERIFASPSITGPNMRSVKLSPDGERVTFLQGKSGDREQLDLWEYHIADEATRLLVDSQVLVPEAETLSDEEKARRERQRLAGLRGIVNYQWSSDGDALLFPLNGDLYFYELATGKAKRLTETDAFETDPQMSPNGKKVAFIRAQNIYVIDIQSGQENQLTQDGTGTVHNGVAEFAAQEEMSRSTGYWWSPDSSQIAYIQFDESPVSVTQRYEINAETVTVVDQRYPYTGTPNVILKLGVISANGGQTQWLDLGTQSDFYLPRVNWLSDSKQLSYQWQSRDQQLLELRATNLQSGQQSVLLKETANTWVNLHSDLRFLKDSEHFLWSSERSGFRHLYLYNNTGEVIRTITTGDWQIDGIEGVDESTGLVYFTANKDNVTERQLYVVNFKQDNAPIMRVTQRSGMHGIDMAKDASVYIDNYSSRSQPQQVSLHAADGNRLTWLLENALNADHPYTPYLEQHQPTEFGELTANDGQTLHYRILKPANFVSSRRYPVYVYVYGGPGAQVVGNSWDRRLLIEQYMAQQGFVVFSVDNRGSARRGTRFENPIYKSMGTVEVEDQLTGVEYLKSLPYVDPDRIGIFGWSYGGYMTLMSVLQGKGAYALGVSVAPVTDWRLYDTHYTERYMQTPEKNADGYRTGNVLSYTENLPAKQETPLIVIHGMADDNVLFTHSTLLYKDLQDKGKLFDVMTYPGAKHGISGSTAQTHVNRTITDYFIKHLSE